MIKAILEHLPISNRKKLQVLKYVFLMNWLKREHVYPFYASFKITNRCPLHCPFCNVWLTRQPELSQAAIFKILDNIENSSVFVVVLEGGEPFVRRDFLDILAYASTKDLIIGVSTNGLYLDRYNIRYYARFLDFFNLSIDESHGNLHLLNQLTYFTDCCSIVTVHVVVTRDNIYQLEEKIDSIARAGIKAVVMPATPLDKTVNLLPNMQILQREIQQIEKKYKNVLLPTAGMFRRPKQGSGCSSASIVIGADGGLYYPCRVKESRPINLVDVPLMKYLESPQAYQARRELAICDRRCYWYQNFTCGDYIRNPISFFRTIRPYLTPNKIIVKQDK